MSLRILSVAPALVSLLFFSTFVVAGVIVANCTSLSWTFNSIGQSPCIVAANMLATCNAGNWTLPSLPPGDAYGGPPTRDKSNKCECSTVGYSLISACVTCQEREPFNWSQYVVNCTSIMPPSQFPNPVPPGVYVPHWAILDVTNENAWNANESYAAGDGPEYGPGAIFGASGVYTSSASTSSASASSTAAPTRSRSTSHVGAIVGGIVGGLIISITTAAILLYLRRRRSQAVPPDVASSQPMLTDGAVSTVRLPSPAPQLTMKLYDPNDPTTFPGYQGGPIYPDIPSVSQVPSSSHVGSAPSGSTLVDMQTSVTNTREYRGLPMPHS